MKAFLLLAGRSRRFWPLREKSLFPVCGKTLAQIQVERLRRAGFADITLIAGSHNRKELRRLLPDVKLLEQKDLDLGMQGACLEALKKEKGPVLIASGNDVVDPEAFAKLKKEASQAKIDGAILAQKVHRHFPGGYLMMKGKRITGIVEKPAAGKEPSRLVNIVAHVHNDPQKLLSVLKTVRNARDDGYELALNVLFQTAHYRAVPYDGTWLPVKYPWHLLPLLHMLLKEVRGQRIARSVQIHPSAVIEGNVIIGEGTRVLPHASILGPCVIGENCIIGNNAFVRSSSIGNDCVIGYSTEVKGSVLAGPVWTHMTYLGDSIIGGNVSFGGACITGNLRLDEGEISSSSGPPGRSAIRCQTGLTKLGLITGDDNRFGIQAGCNPGIRVGRGSFIAGGVFLTEDIPEGSFVTQERGALKIRKNTSAIPSMEGRTTYRKQIS